MSSIPICSICCDKFSSNSNVQSTKCGHLFHRDCIQPWLSSHSTCPDCRQSSTLLHRVFLNFDGEAREELVSHGAFTIATPQEIENLIIKLSLEEAKRKSAENSVEENARKFQTLKASLEEEQRRRRVAEEAMETLKKKLNTLALTSSKKSPEVVSSNNNKIQNEAPKVTIQIRKATSVCPIHYNTTNTMSYMDSDFPFSSPIDEFTRLTQLKVEELHRRYRRCS